MKEEKIIKYKMTQDFDAILKAKTGENNVRLEQKENTFIRNRDRLLPYVLQLIDSMISVHNMKCNKSNSSTTGEDGLFAISKIDKEKQLKLALNRSYWSSNGEHFGTLVGVKVVKIWLNSGDGKHVHTPNLEYSMTSLNKGNTYGESIEMETELLIERLAKYYHDNWD